MNKIRRRICIFGLLISAVLFCFGVFTACGKTETITYTVSVAMPDDTPATGVTVAWSKDGKEAATASVDDTGKATAELTADVYDVTLSNLPIGYTYNTGVKTDRLGTENSITLIESAVSYTATVTLPDGTPASGVTVTWSLDGKAAGTAKTNASGEASANLTANTYTVTAEGAVNGVDYYTETDVTATGENRGVSIQLTVDERIEYTVSVRSEGGVNLPNVAVTFYKDGDEILTGKTEEGGILTAKLRADDYTVYLDLDSVPGYSAKEPDVPYASVTEDNISVSFTLSSAVINATAPSSNKYVVGSIMYDFTVTTYDGEKTITLSELFETKKAVVFNFWYTGCSWCLTEMPALQEAYEEYSDDLEVIGLDPSYAYSDTNTSIALFVANQASYITFPLAIDTAAVAYMFDIEAFPTTVIVDRYGAVALIHEGAVTDVDTWREIFEEYTADDYTQTFTPGETTTDSTPTEYAKPTDGLQMPSSAEIIEAVVDSNDQDKFTFHDAATEGTSDAVYSWPWLIETYNGKTVLAPSNSGTHYSFSTIYLTVELQANEAFTFNFFSSSEEYDVCYVVDVNNNLLPWTISGEAQDWQTCYAFVANRAGTYKFAFLYLKDTSRSSGDDAVFITDLRICDADEISETVDIIRQAAEDMNDNATGYDYYATVVYNDDDGYYHVNDADGPILLADMMNQTQWSNISLWNYIYFGKSQEYVSDEDGDGTADTPLPKLDFYYDFDGDGTKEDCYNFLETYAYMANNSDYSGLVPVDARLYNLINLIMEQLSDNHTEKEWLEVCKYIDRYGAEGEVPDPTLGLSYLSPIVASEGENHYKMEKLVLPYGYVHYTFTPETSGVYQFYSEDAGDDGARIVVYNIGDGTAFQDPKNVYGDNADDNFSLNLYLTAGKTYHFACATYYPQTTGEFDFWIAYEGETYQEWVAASGDSYQAILDDNGDFIDDDNLVDAVKYVLGEDGVYYAINDNGTTTKLYVDFIRETRLWEESIAQMLNTYPFKLQDGSEGHYYFDWQYGYVWETDGEYLYFDYLPLIGEYCKDYSETIQKYLDESLQNEGDYYGLCEATEDLVDILKFFHYIRGGAYLDDLVETEDGEYLLETTPEDIETNEWLSFCVYYKTYSAESET